MPDTFSMNQVMGGGAESAPAIPTFSMNQVMGGSPAVAPPPVAPAVATTPEMAARQQMMQENQQRGVAGNATGGVLSNFNGLAGGFQRLLSKPVGWVSPTAAENMRIAATRSEAYAPQEGSLVGTAGQMVGGLPGMMTGGIGLAANVLNTGEQAYENLEARKAADESIDGMDELANVAGQSAVSGLATKLGQANITGGMVSRLLPSAANTLAGRMAARAAAGTIFGVGSQVAGNAVSKFTTDPNTPLMQGTGKAALLNAGMETVGGVAHDLLAARARARARARTGAEAVPNHPAQGGGQTTENTSENQVSHAPDNRQEAAPTEQGKENVSSNQGQAAPVEAQPPVQQARPAEGEKLPENAGGNPPQGSERVQAGTEEPAAKSLPELPAGHEGWSYKQLKDWAGENGFETGDAKGKLTLRNKMQDQLLGQEKYLRRYDPLTEAPNATKYHEDADRIFKDADEKGEHTALVETDVAGLKVMNTLYDHAGGDEMLKMAAQAMREELRVPPQRSGRPEDYLGSKGYRIGGDEFPAILRNVDSPEKVKAVMDRVNTNFQKKITARFPDLPPEAVPFIAHNAEIRKPGDTRSVEEIRKIADKGVEPIKNAEKAKRNIPEGRTDLLNYIQKRQAELAAAKTGPTPTPPVEAEPQATPQSDFFARMKEKGKQFVTDESGGATMEATKKLAQRDIVPAAQKTAENLKKSWDALNRFAGTGENLRGKVRDTANDIRTMLGQQEVHTARLETAIKPYRDVMKTMTPDERAAWVDRTESTGATAAKNTQGINMPGQSSDPRLQGLADLSHEQNVKNIADAKKYGIAEANKWDANWVGRDFSDEGGGDRTSVGGSQAFRIKREFDTYSDAKAAVEAAGHKLRFDNEADMLLYKQAQVRKNIDARRMMYEAEDRGQLKWTPDGEKKPETHDTELKDRLAKQDRDVVGPKWLVGKLAGMKHFDAEKFMESDEWKKNTQVLRPGDDMPTDMVKTGQTQAGTFAGDSNTAGLFNNLISAGVNSHAPVLKQIAQVRRAVTASNLAIPAAHASLETIGNAVTMGANALDNLVHGELGLAGKNAMRALNPFAANKLGRQIREQAADPTAHPQLENIVQTVQRGGNKFDLKSVLNADSLKDAQTEWKEGNKIGAVPRLIKGIYSKAVGPLFEHFIPNVKAAYKAAAAETAIARGMSGAELDRHMSKVQDNADNILGMVKRDFQFQHKILTDVEDIAFNAPKFAEGTVRFAGAAVRDTAKALHAAVTGKEPKVTPAMYTALSGLIMHSIGAAMFQMAYSTATTGKPQMPDKLEDYIRPRTGRVDDKGREQRVSVLSPFSFLFSAAKDTGKSLTSRTATLWRSAKNVMDNADERNTQIANPNDSFLKRMKDRAAYMGKEAMPFAAQNLMQNKQEGHKTTADQVVGEGMGFHFSYGASTPAEKAALDTVYSHARQAPRTREEADKSDLIRGLSERVRSKDPAAMADVRQAVREGKLGPHDVQTIHKRAIEAPGLKGILGQSDLGAKDIMEQVWPKMSPQERKENQWMIRGKVGRAENLPPADRQRYFKQINSDMKASAA